MSDSAGSPPSPPCDLYIAAPYRGAITLRCGCGWQREFDAPVAFGTVGWNASQHVRARKEAAQNAPSATPEDQ